MNIRGRFQNKRGFKGANGNKGANKARYQKSGLQAQLGLEDTRIKQQCVPIHNKKNQNPNN